MSDIFSLMERRTLVKNLCHEGYTFSQIAAAIGKTETTARNDYYHGREKKHREYREIKKEVESASPHLCDVEYKQAFYLIACCRIIALKKFSRPKHDYLILSSL